jgi:hypothetical protein
LLQFLLRLFLVVFFVFIVPALATAAWWGLSKRPADWRSADWSSSGILPKPSADDGAAIYVLGARTGGLKGAFSLHTWIVLKREGAATYNRYDKVGWGAPVRTNARAADGRWYSNTPSIVYSLRGPEAQRLIPKVEAAIAAYPYSKAGDYRIWPGPNSNSFVANVLHAVPELGARMPPNAVGRDFADGFWSVEWLPEQKDLRGTIAGLLGFSAGKSGIELQFLGLVAGLDFLDPAVLVPAFGRVGVWPAA